MDSAALPTLSLAQSVLAAQPCSVLLGARLTSFGTRGATLELDVRDDLRQQHGFVHGGVVAYLVDNAITFAAGAALGPDLVTAGFTVDHLRPTRQGRLRAHAVVVRAGTSQATLRCDVHAVDADHHATLCAVGQGRVSLRSTQGDRGPPRRSGAPRPVAPCADHYDAGGDSRDLEDLLAADVHWSVPGGNALAGLDVGVDQVLDYLRRRRTLAGARFARFDGTSFPALATVSPH